MGTTAHQKYPKNYTFDGKKVLNIGCGFTKFTAKNVTNLDKYECCDPDILFDLEDSPLPFKDETFDYVFANHVFEHLHNWWQCFEECSRVLKPGGKLDVYVPGSGSDSELGYRDHVSIINLCSFYGVTGYRPIKCNAWTYENAETPASDLKLIQYKQYLIEGSFIKLLPQSAKNWCALHLRNMLDEEGYIFIKYRNGDLKMPKENTVINLYKCFSCGRLRYEKEFASGDRCKCGSGRVTAANPTKLNIFRYFLNNPKMIKVWFKENVKGN